MLAAFVLLVTMAACAGPEKRAATSPEARAALLHNIAASYAQTGDLTAAKTALAALKVANAAQLLISQAEDAVRQGAPSEEVQAYADLAQALGIRSRIVMAYLEPTPAEVVPTEAPTQAPTLATAKAAATSAPSATASPTPAPAATQAQASAPAATAETRATASDKPRVSARDNVNLRAGPGTNYPTIGQLKGGAALDITGRNQSGDWWRVRYPSEDQAWISGVLVDVSGPIDTVAVVKNIPTAAPAPTRPPAATAAPAPQAPAPAPAPTAAPKPSDGMQYHITGFRLKPIGTDAQQCHGGDHNIWVYVKDGAGNPIDGVRVREVFTNSIHETGSKGTGAAVWDIYRGGGGQVEIVDGAGNRIGELSRGMSDDWPPFDLMLAAGYCSCKPHPDPASCQADLEGHSYLFAVGHYVYEVTYQRTS